MQITVQTNRMSFDGNFTPRITVIASDHSVPAQDSNPAERFAALDARQAGHYVGDSFGDRGIRESALHD